MRCIGVRIGAQPGAKALTRKVEAPYPLKKFDSKSVKRTSQKIQGVSALKP
jgi:hypothetical protein